MTREKICPVCQRVFLARNGMTKYCDDCAPDVRRMQQKKANANFYAKRKLERSKSGRSILKEVSYYHGLRCHGRSGSMLNEDPGHMPYIAHPVVIWRGQSSTIR